MISADPSRTTCAHSFLTSPPSISHRTASPVHFLSTLRTAFFCIVCYYSITGYRACFRGGIGILPRLITLDVSSNLLTGHIPSSYTNRSSAMGNPGPPFLAASFYNNPGLCGPPLRFFCPSKSSTGFITGFITGFVVGCTGCLLGVLCGYILVLWMHFQYRKEENALLADDYLWAKRIKTPKSVRVSLFERPRKELNLFDFMAVTNYFDQDSIIYESSSGMVYVAVLPDGSMLDVQRLCHMQQDVRSKMDSLWRMRHKNLVPLLGYCVAGLEKLLLYKHMRRSLWENLHYVSKENKLDWITRLWISIGAARGLAWLHHGCNPCIIHRNISSKSILLDDDYEPRISDFGLACLLNLVDDHINTDEKWGFGELGYIAPKYPHTRIATVKGDVYSFGVVLLELATGRKANAGCTIGGIKWNLADWVLFLVSKGCVEEALDMSIGGESSEDVLTQILRVGCACVLPEPKNRPTMYEVYQMLRQIGQQLMIINDELDVYADVSSSEEPEEHFMWQNCGSSPIFI